LINNNYDYLLTEHSLSDEEEMVPKKSLDSMSILEMEKQAEIESRAFEHTKKMSLDIKNFEIIENRAE